MIQLKAKLQWKVASIIIIIILFILTGESSENQPSEGANEDQKADKRVEIEKLVVRLERECDELKDQLLQSSKASRAAENDRLDIEKQWKEAQVQVCTCYQPCMVLMI